MSRGELSISRWLEAHSDRSAGLTTFPQGALLCDVAGDSDHRLVLLDVNPHSESARSRLKVYKGTSLLTSGQILPDVPSSVISFYTTSAEPKIPAIAVACAFELLIFKNNKPFYKFTVPNSPLIPLEEDAWKRIVADSGDGGLLEDVIKDLRTINFNLLSGRSQKLLSLKEDEVEKFLLEGSFNAVPVKAAPIVCMATLNRSSLNEVACPVLGTEDGVVYILDPQTFTILHQANVCNIKATPYIIKTEGHYDVEFRIIIACRENTICILRRNWLEGKCIIQLVENIVDMLLIPGDNFIVIGTTDKTLHCYTKRGQRVWSSSVISTITCLCLIPLKHLTTNLIAVGLQGGSIHLFHGRHPVDYTQCSDTPSCIIFGQMGQEEHVMAIVTMSGTLNFKILKRTADFNFLNNSNNQDRSSGNTNNYNKPLPLPKRSKLFLEQSIREKEHPTEMHQSFQQDLVKLRLTAARAVVQSIQSMEHGDNVKEQVKLSAQVLGLGPKFTLILTLENMNADKSLGNLLVVFHAKTDVYSLSNYVFQVPLVPPGLSYKIEIKVTETVGSDSRDDEQNGEVIRVFVNRKGEAQPILAASINMPPTELGY